MPATGSSNRKSVSLSKPTKQCAPAVALLKELQRTSRVLTHHRGALIRRLIQSPSWLEHQQGLQHRS